MGPKRNGGIKQTNKRISKGRGERGGREHVRLPEEEGKGMLGGRETKRRVGIGRGRGSWRMSTVSGERSTTRGVEGEGGRRVAKGG